MPQSNARQSTARSRNLLSGTGLVVAAILFVAINVFSNAVFQSARLDLTEHKLYSVSQGSRNIVANLDEPITLRLYLSEKLATTLPEISSYATRVRELLQEYARASRGKVTVSVIDPEPFSEAEDRAVAYGMQAIPVDAGNTLFYFGLVGTSSTDEEQVIPFFQPEREEFLEYDITKLIYQLGHPERNVIGLMSALPLSAPDAASPFGRPPAPQGPIVVEQIQQLFDVRTLDTDVVEIPGDVDVLMLVHPKNLSESALYAIDQFVLRGGHMLVFVDPFAEAETPLEDPSNPLAALQSPRNSNLEPLFASWGVELEEGKVVSDRQLAKRVQINRGSRLLRVDYPVWLDVGPDYLNQDDVTTAKLPGITLASAGILHALPDAPTTLTPLIESSAEAMRIDAQRVAFVDPEGLLRDFRAENTRFTMAARLTGHVKSAFPEGPPALSNTDAEAPNGVAHLAESTDAINVVIVADTDLLQDRFWVQVQNFLGQRIAIPMAGNGSFVTNLTDNLSGSNDLISIRNRAGYQRPFTRVREIQRNAEQTYREKEQLLQSRLEETERKIRDLQNRKDADNTLLLSSAQQQEILRFRQEKVEIRKQLRDVQHGLRKDIEQLEAWLRFLNIGFIPLLIAISGAALGFKRLHKRRSAANAGHE